MLDEVLNTPFFYFSYDYDVSHSLQQLNSMTTDFKQVIRWKTFSNCHDLHNDVCFIFQLGLAERANQQFVWNGFILKEFMTNDMRRFCLPIVHGCKIKKWLFNQKYRNVDDNLICSLFAVISINQVNVNNNNFTWALISRRSVNRAGTRLFCRGINAKVGVNSIIAFDFHI